MKEYSPYFKDTFDNLSQKNQKKIVLYCQLFQDFTIDLVQVKLNKYGFKKDFFYQKRIPLKNLIEIDLERVSEELTNTDLRLNWVQLRKDNNYIKEDIKRDNESRLTDFHGIRIEDSATVYNIHMNLLVSNFILDEYLNVDIDEDSIDTINCDSLPEFDKILQFLVNYTYLIIRMRQLENKDYVTPNMGKPRLRVIKFKDIFWPNYKDRIPDEVIRLLGPGHADAWRMVNNQKIWNYEGPESAIMIPFFLLREKGYICKEARKEKFFITSWLNEFGVEYKERTFDDPPKDFTANQYFKDYINRLK